MQNHTYLMEHNMHVLQELSHKLSVELSSMVEDNLSMRFMLINSCTTIYLLYENHAHYKTIYDLTKTENPIKSIKIYNSTRKKKQQLHSTSHSGFKSHTTRGKVLS